MSLSRALFSSVATLLLVSLPAEAQSISGEQRVWHTVTLTFTGPSLSESGSPNPFLDYRFTAEFVHQDSSTTITVPGYFAADGNAAESSATSGDKWQIKFTPDKTGAWNYTTSCRTAADAALSDNPGVGTAVPSLNNQSGSLNIGSTNKTSPDFRARGFLQYTGDRYYRFQDGSYFLKGGADSPENFLGYYAFDNTFDNGGSGNDLNGTSQYSSRGQTFSYHGDGLHHYDAHLQDWTSGDPQWKGSSGREIVGAVNYLASQGVNSIYFLTMNVSGDGREVFPWTSYSERERFDASKLAQWDIVFSHMTSKGVKLHVLTQETENDQLLDGGDLGNDRKLYYRELIARFAHHPALVWNLGEENTNTTAQRKAFADYIRALDPYNHPIVIHTYPGQQSSVYQPLLGFTNINGPSIQGSRGNVHSDTKNWISQSAASGHQWVVTSDEIGPASAGVVPDASDPTHDDIRKDVLWGNLMAGGAGVEYYFGYNYPHSDLDCEDFTSRAEMWRQTRVALEFFKAFLPFNEMDECDSLVGPSTYCLGKAGEIYAVYTKNGGSPSLTLPSGTFSVSWFNPMTGGGLYAGSVATVQGPGSVSLGTAPFSGDALALVREPSTIAAPNAPGQLKIILQ